VSVVVDTNVVVALLDADDVHHAEAVAWVGAYDDDLVTTPLALAEMDHFAGREGATKVFHRDLDRGVYGVRWWADALDETLAIARRRPDIGLTDASLVALADRLRTDRIATFDHAHFRTLRSKGGRPFTLLPADA
jgi:predicted nucleic acid-binding protein